MKKRLLALSMAMIMVAGTLTACTPEQAPADGGETATEAPADGGEVATEAPADGGEAATEAPDVQDAATMEAPSTEGWDESKKIYAYSWNDEFGSRLQMVLDEYPQYADYVEFINLGVSGTDGTYQTAIETVRDGGNLADGFTVKDADGNDKEVTLDEEHMVDTTGKYPSLIPADNDVAKNFTESAYVLSMEDVGITKDMYANAYQYTIDYATVDGDLMAVTWQATPGCLIYRTDIAEEVLGTSDPAEVQEAVKDWDSFFETAQLMKDAGYAMVSGPDETKYALWDQQTQPWVDDSENLNLDKSVVDELETAKKLYDGGYVISQDAKMWTTDWSAGYEGNVFCYFGCTWSVYWCIATTEDSPTSTFGKFHICPGPVSYHWGGTYVCVGADTPNPELCGFLLYELCCDKDMMYKISAETFDYVNNKAAMEQILADGKGAAPVLGGQNPVEIWLEAAPKINLSNSTYMDASIKQILDTAREGYIAGTFSSVDDAVQFAKEEIGTKYSNINVQ